jgi:hypothetical protein
MADSPDLAPDEKLCPFCAETIKKAAIRCRYCHSELAAETLRVPEEGHQGPSRRAVPPPPPPTPPVIEHTPEEQPPPSVSSDEEPPPPVEPLEAARSSRTPLLSSLRLMVGLLVLCLVLAGVAAYAFSTRDDSAKNGGPITSAAARASGLEAATTLTQKVLSYNWQTLDKDVKSSEAVLAPSFRTEYAKTMAGVHAQTLKNQVKLTAQAVATSVVSATPRKVVALVFVNQSTTAKGTTNERLDQNRVLVTLTRDAGEWRVSKMDAF